MSRKDTQDNSKLGTLSVSAPNAPREALPAGTAPTTVLRTALPMRSIGLGPTTQSCEVGSCWIATYVLTVRAPLLPYSLLPPRLPRHVLANPLALGIPCQFTEHRKHLLLAGLLQCSGVRTLPQHVHPA